VLQQHSVINAHTTRMSRWLRERRLRLALWIAVLEGIVVAVRGDISRWTVVVIAALVLVVYISLRERINWDAGRQILWIVAASQVMALLVVILAFVVGVVALVLVALFAILALVYLFSDLRRS
jgi:FtsH-binding integral membrane protein